MAEKLENPYEMGIIYRIYAQIKAGIYSACDNDISVQNALPADAAYYYHEACRMLRDVYSPVDEQYLDAVAEKISEN